MDIHILIDAPDEPGAMITFDTTPNISTQVLLIPMLQDLQGFIDHNRKLAEKAFEKEHIFFSKFSPEKQRALLEEFRRRFTLADLQAHIEANTPKLKIIKP